MLRSKLLKAFLLSAVVGASTVVATRSAFAVWTEWYQFVSPLECEVIGTPYTQTKLAGYVTDVAMKGVQSRNSFTGTSAVTVSCPIQQVPWPFTSQSQAEFADGVSLSGYDGSSTDANSGYFAAWQCGGSVGNLNATCGARINYTTGTTTGNFNKRLGGGFPSRFQYAGAPMLEVYLPANSTLKVIEMYWHEWTD